MDFLKWAKSGVSINVQQFVCEICPQNSLERKKQFYVKVYYFLRFYGNAQRIDIT